MEALGLETALLEWNLLLEPIGIVGHCALP